jgi:hypothetical protein
MSAPIDKLVENYLKRLNVEAAGLPRSIRRELVQEIGEHIAAARSELAEATEVEIRSVLERLGAPAEIAAEARDRLAVGKSRWKEVATLVLLPIGGLALPVLGWIVGIFLLWVSDAWRTRDKLLGTLLFPGGLLLPVALGVLAAEAGCGTILTPQLSPRPIADACTAPDGTAAWEIALVVLLIVVPLVTTVYLARGLRRVSSATAT